MNTLKNRISILSIGMGIVLWAIIARSPIPLLTAAAIFIHEAGHVVGARLVRVNCGGFRLMSFEARLSLINGLISYKKEFFICAMGPLFNALSFIPILVCGTKLFRSDSLSFFATVSASLAMLNLLPIGDFDGGRMLFCVLSPLLGLRWANIICRTFSFFSLFALWCVSVYIMIRIGTSVSLFLFSATLFLRIFTVDPPF